MSTCERRRQQRAQFAGTRPEDHTGHPPTRTAVTMNAAATSAGALALAWALLFVTGCSASVFETAPLTPTFATLDTRGCLPSGFDESPTQPLATDCGMLVSGPGLPQKCQASPVEALFYNCYANGRGLLGAGPNLPNGAALEEAIAAIYAGIKDNKLELSDDFDWLADTFQIIDDCQAAAAAGMSVRQEAVYAFLCLKWSWFSKCDIQQEDGDMLDAEGKIRRADFLCGDCPLSPGGPALKAALESVAGRTLADCSNGLCDSPDAQQRYDAAIEKITCMLQNFVSAGVLDFSQLKDAIVTELTGANSEGAELLLDVVNQCDGNTMPEDFVKCWADIGIFSCIYEQANEVAADFPKQCKLSV